MRAFIALVLATCCASAQAVGVPGQGTWETTLHARDINRDGITDALYDSVLDITWLADAKYSLTVGAEPNPPIPWLPGQLDVGSGIAWAAGLSVHGITGWRLHEMLTQLCVDEGCMPTQTELTHLWGVTLGNGTTLTNTGGFVNMGPDSYWSQTLVAPGVPVSGFAYSSGLHTSISDEVLLRSYMWPVRDGDVALVPEPNVAMLTLLGLAAMVGWKRRSAGVRRSPRKAGYPWAFAGRTEVGGLAATTTR